MIAAQKLQPVNPHALLQAGFQGAVTGWAAIHSLQSGPMDVSIFRHDRNASPTLREDTPAARVAITDRTPPERGTSRHGARGVPPRLDEIARTTRYANRVTESKRPGQSFTTFSWPADHPQAIPVDHAHQRLDIRHLHSLEAQAYSIRKIQAQWGGRPILHTFEQTSAIVESNLDGLDRHDGAVQTFINCKTALERLQNLYQAFARDASELLENCAGRGGVGQVANWNAATSAPLLRIVQSLWPTIRFKNAAEKTDWVRRTLRAPQPFIAQSHDALSLALGRAGAGIAQAKIIVFETGRSKSADEQHHMMQSISAADHAYLIAEAMFTNINISIDPAVVKGHGVLAGDSMPPV